MKRISQTELKHSQEPFYCPKCQTEQQRAEQCSSCGLIFEKYFRAKEERAARTNLRESEAPVSQSRGKGSVALLAVLILILGAVIWRGFGRQPETRVLSENGAAISPKNDPNLLHVFVPYAGTVVIKHDRSFMNTNQFRGPTQLDAMDLEQIAAYRKERVQHYAQLNFFHPGYDPLKPPHNKIYSQITPMVPWVTTVPYYIANPYILLSITQDNRVAPFTIFLDDAGIVYSNGKIVATHAGINAKLWREWLAGRPTNQNVVNITMANAWDAGFYYVHLVENQSENVEPSTDPNNVGKTFYSQSSFYHVGQHQKNNISPYDGRSRITLKDINSPTRLVFHLWRKQPKMVDAKPDMIYEINVSQ